jgi:photosystem II stability/assembly factor-like uncharacterized protein
MKTIIKVLCFAVIIQFSFQASAQWQPSSSGLPLGIVICYAESSGVILAGTATGVFATNNFGNSWYYSSSGINATNKMISCFGKNSAGIYASVGYLIYFSNNSGTSWSQIYDFGTSNRIQALVTKNDTLFAATYEGGVMMSANNGASWLPANAGLTTNNVSSILVKGQYLFAGTATEGVFMSGNSGVNWTSVNTGMPAASSINCLETDGNNVFSGTGLWYYPNIYPDGLYFSSNNGSNWIQSNIPTNKSVIDILSVGNIVLASEENIFRSLDHGATWSVFMNGIDTSGYLGARFFFESGNYIFCSFETGQDTIVLYRINKDEVLTVNETPNPNYSVSLSPNPTSGSIHMQIPEQFGLIKSIEIYNSIGQLQTRKTGETNLDISSYPTGLYFVIATNTKGETLRAKVVKE